MQDARVRELSRLKRITLDPRAPAPQRSPERAARRFLRYGEPAFRRLFQSEAGLRIVGPGNDRQIARCVLFASREQRRAWEGGIEWYYANALLFLRYAPVACRLIHADLAAEDMAHHLMLWDAVHLLQQHNRRLRASDLDYGHAESDLVPFSALFQRSRRVLSGRSVDVNIGAATICLAIESRLKSALGAYELRSGADEEAASRLPMTYIFKAFDEHRHRIRMAVELDLLVLVYNWANNFRHVGLRSYGWLNYFANDLVAPLFAPASGRGSGADREVGIHIDRQTLGDIRDSIRAAAAPRSRAAVIGGPGLDVALSL